MKKGPKSLLSLPKAAFCEWCIDWISPQVLGTNTQQENTCLAFRKPFWCYLIIIPLKLNRVTSYLEVTKPTQEEYEDQNILKIKLTVEVLLWETPSADHSHQEQSMFDYRGQFISPNTTASGKLFIKSHHMLMMLQMLSAMTAMPLCWKILSVQH